ncbi:MAG: HEAT repeat domain-containing protein, partial [Planctomycetia bacterium]
LEETIICYHSPNERRNAEYWLSSWKEGYYGDYWGRAQHFLLPSLCAERRRIETIGLIGVLERKFAEYPKERFVRGPQHGAGFVGSTLPSKSLERLSDRSWLKLVHNKNTPKDRASWRWKGEHYEESTIRQFSGDLQRIAKRFPERFGRLAMQFADDVHPSYKAAILEGLKQTEPKEVPDDEKPNWEPAPVTIIEQVLDKFDDTSHKTYALNFCRLLRDRAEERWSDEALEQLIGYACGHPDPKENRLCIGNPDGDFNAENATIGNLETNSLNGVRSVAALAIGELLWNHPDLFERFKPTIIHLCKDSHPAVRIATVRACLPILNLDKDFAIDCFCEASNSDLRVAASNAGIHFFNCGIKSHKEKLEPLIIKMLKASQADVVKQGASEVAARWLFHEYFAEELKLCLEGSVSQRKGVAEVATHFVAKKEHFEKCKAIIEVIMDDPEEEVRKPLFTMVREADILGFPEGVSLIQSFIESKAFRDHFDTLVSCCLGNYSGSLLPFAEVLFSICEQVVGPIHEANHYSYWSMPEFLPLLMRLYEQAEESRETRIVNRCLDALDKLFEKRVGVVHEIAKTIG